MVLDALAVRMAAGSAGSAESFRADSPCPILPERWDTENASLLRLGCRLPSRFAAFMDGEPWRFHRSAVSMPVTKDPPLLSSFCGRWGKLKICAMVP